MTVLAIDQGTSATKALVVADDGRPLGAATVAVHPRALGDGAVEQDPGELLDSILAAGREALADASVPAGELSGVGLGNQGETILAWDRRSGEPAGPAISWQDRRAATVVERLSDRAERLTAITGLPLDPYFAAPKMAWLAQRSQPQATITTVDAWLTHRLCGAFVTDAATASRTMLLDLAAGEWSAEACAAFGVDAGAQPAIVGCAQPVGETDAFGATVPVTALVVDQQAALLAQSCLAPGEGKCTYGTGAFVLVNAGARRPDPSAALSASVAWRVGDALAYCLDGQLYTAGAALDWLRRLGLPAEITDLDALAGRGRPGRDAPVFVPALAGLGAPQWAPQARGAWSGLTLSAGADDLVDAVLWGIAAAVTRLAEAIGDHAGAPLPALRVDGGLSRCARLMQAQADLLGVPVQRYPSPDATALGIAALARVGAGAAADLPAAVGDWRASDVHEPHLDRDAAAEILHRHDAAVQACLDQVAP